MSNENLRKAQKAKNDEFFTLYGDIEAELVHYKEYLKDKIIYCNCDQPSSNFVKFFNDVKEEWGIKDVWHTSIQEGISYDSPQAKEMLAKCDVVISNPPFSKTRLEYIPLLMQSGKQFLFIGNLNMATYKEVFPLIRDGKMWCGYTFPKSFVQPDGTQKKFGNIVWWTNLLVKKEFRLNPDVKYYGNEDKYPRYDNYDAINVDRLKDIPSDYSGIMGVPITFIQSYTPPRMTGTAFGSLASAKAQTDKTSEQMANTTICDTLLDCRNDLITDGGGTISVQTSACSDYSDTNMTQTAKTSDSLKSTAEAFTKEYLFDLIGVDESCGSGLGGGTRLPNTIDHALINGKRKFTRLFIRYSALPIIKDGLGFHA